MIMQMRSYLLLLLIDAGHAHHVAAVLRFVAAAETEPVMSLRQSQQKKFTKRIKTELKKWVNTNYFQQLTIHRQRARADERTTANSKEFKSSLTQNSVKLGKTAPPSVKRTREN